MIRKLIDLTDYYNVAQSETWQDPWPHDNELSELLVGIGVFGQVSFDVRGLIQLEQQSGRYPSRVDGIVVDRFCQRLHFLSILCDAPWGLPVSGRSDGGVTKGQFHRLRACAVTSQAVSLWKE